MSDSKIIGKNFDDFIGAGKVRTGHKVESDGLLRSKKDRVEQVSYRLPGSQLHWLQNNIDGNVNYAVSKMLALSIDLLKRQLNDGPVNIDDFTYEKAKEFMTKE